MSQEQNMTENQEGQQYEVNPEDVTGFSKGGGESGKFNRKRVMMVICVTFAVVVGGGLIFNITGGGSRQSRTEDDPRGAAGRAPPGFLAGQLNRAAAALQSAAADTQGEPPVIAAPPVSELPVVAWNDTPAARFVPPPPAQAAPPPPPPPQHHQAAAPPQRPAHYLSPLMPVIEGRLIASSLNSPNSPAPLAPPNSFNSPGSLNSPQSFNSPPQGDGNFIAENSLWIGTIIPAVLVTAINTDLPGNVLARVTENVFDSRTGRALLIPQGTILFARYNNDVSFAQSRVQIAWDTLIRPDGFEVQLGGMDGVDRRGMAGQEAVYRENWFRYLQAAGLIAMFSIANARMSEQASQHTSEAVAGNIAQANAEFMSQVGGSIVSRAMNIQPTLTVASGTSVNVMINRNITLPPIDSFPVVQRHRLE